MSKFKNQEIKFNENYKSLNSSSLGNSILFKGIYYFVYSILSL